jgi:hypothetical protein
MYREANGAMVATEIRSVPAAAGAGERAESRAARATARETAAPTATAAAKGTETGKVKSVTASTMVITHDGKDSTYAVDANTKVVGKGAGTATRGAGGAIAFSSLVGVGDTVSVDFTGSGQAMRAKEVRITVNADRKPAPTSR